ncbi:MAG: ABC transporter permease [Abditibacteriota bacterium]|nr:ABC transporter permease [Abditibacteriota bacterium]
MFRILKRELGYIANNRILAAITILMPLVWALILAGVFSEKTVTGQPSAIMDLDGSPLSAQLVEKSLQASPWFDVKYYPRSMTEAKRLFDANRIQALFIIPEGFERDVKSKKRVVVEVELGKQNLASGSVLSVKAGELFSTLSGQIEFRAKERDMPPSAAMASVLPVRESFHFLNNPAFVNNYAAFLALGMFLNCVMVAAMFYPTRCLLREIKDLTETEYHSCPSPFRLLLGKTIAYLLVVFPGCILGLHACILFCHVPLSAPLWQLWALTLWFCAICAWIGMSIPVLFNNQEFGFSAAAILFMPSFLVSGYTWPDYMMPGLLQIYSDAMPLKYYLFAMRELTYGKYLNYDLTPYINGLMLWTCAAFALAFAMTLILIYRTGKAYDE